MAAESSLACWIVGLDANFFLVDILLSKTVDHLKKAIKKEKENALNRIDSDQLEIWKASDPTHSAPAITDAWRHTCSSVHPCGVVISPKCWGSLALVTKCLTPINSIRWTNYPVISLNLWSRGRFIWLYNYLVSARHHDGVPPLKVPQMRSNC